MPLDTPEQLKAKARQYLAENMPVLLLLPHEYQGCYPGSNGSICL